MKTSSQSIAAGREEEGSWTKLELRGNISSRNVLHVELDNGISVTAPEEVIFKQGSLKNVGDIIDIACKLTGWCGGGGGGGGGGGDGCTTITIQNPDGSTTTIKHCPAKVMA
jgi:hypothetical protein